MSETEAQRLRREANEALSDAIRRAEASGELRHLHGKPLDLSDDSPDWLIKRMLKQAGFTHPLLERANDLDAARDQAEAILERLRSRREWLARPETRRTPQQVVAFNEMRSRALDEYREKLVELNNGIRDYNLTAPTALHKRHVRVDRAMDAATEAIPPLEPADPAPSAPSWSPIRTIWRRWRGSH